MYEAISLVLVVVGVGILIGDVIGAVTCGFHK